MPFLRTDPDNAENNCQIQSQIGLIGCAVCYLGVISSQFFAHSWIFCIEYIASKYLSMKTIIRYFLEICRYDLGSVSKTCTDIFVVTKKQTNIQPDNLLGLLK